MNSQPQVTSSLSDQGIDVVLFERLKVTHAFDRKHFKDWNEFIVYLYQEYNKRILKKGEHNYHMMSGINPTGTKKKGAVQETSLWMAMDFDDMTGYTVDTFLRYLMGKGYEFVAYNSKSCQRDDPRMRVVVPLSRKVKDDEYLHFWTNMRQLYGNIFDKQTNYIEKTQGFPAQYEGAFNFFTHHKGLVVNVDEVKNMYPYVINTERKLQLKGLADYRMKSLDNDNITWSGVNDCPFVNQKSLADFYSIYHTDNSGRYRKMYSLMVSIACRAVKQNYPITVEQIVDLCEQIDYKNIYRGRAWGTEANRALNHALLNSY